MIDNNKKNNLSLNVNKGILNNKSKIIIFIKKNNIYTIKEKMVNSSFVEEYMRFYLK